ncbi:hypothetical protein OG292_21185 [Streptomyces sp. NBC_01511]|uniref:Uncharacterized protein n=1 Tax=Streptomyces niveus TaxID=193462 RepID=A0ABZ2A5U9_STRNV|nr:hypothetical protein [Streptomyces niveus]WTA60124.1 hypothetical protein OG211_17470 [Streptomyces niveus]
MSKPSISEIAAFLTDLRAVRTGVGDPAALAVRKAELLERIAAASPDDIEAAEVARVARRAADLARGQ